jgi:VCBS repeat-containing protein
VVTEEGGAYSQFTRLQAPGALDANHLDGVGAIWLLSHLSTPSLGSPGILNLHGAEFSLTVRGTDFDLNGGQLGLWVCRYVPGTDLVENVYVGLQVTNWFNSGGDIGGEITDEWRTITLAISSDPSDWTYAGNRAATEGDWAQRYSYFGLEETLASVDATLHLVILNRDPDAAPSGFLDLAGISLTTQTEAVPTGRPVANEVFYGLEDQPIEGVLAGELLINGGDVRFVLVEGSVANGSVIIDEMTGQFVFTTPENYFGPRNGAGYASFSYAVSDGVSTSEPRLVLVYVGGINDAPLLSARDFSHDIAGGLPWSFTLFSGTDVDGNRLTFELVEGSVTGGALALDRDTGRYTFIPEEGFVGEASFAYAVSDGQLTSVVRTITLNVLGAEELPPSFSYRDAISALTTGDQDRWISLVIQLADGGDPNASYHYGTWLNAGFNGVARDKTLARHYFEQAADTVPEAAVALAYLYLTGEGGARDYAFARELLEINSSYMPAVYQLAVLKDLGLGGDQDQAAAVQGYLKAALSGHAEAAYTLGRRYLAGTGVEASAEDAYFWLGVGLRLNAAPGGATFRDLLTFNQALAAQTLEQERIDELDASIAGWVPGQPTPVNDAPALGGEEAAFVQELPGDEVVGSLNGGADRDGDSLSFRLVDGSVENGSLTLDLLTGQFTFLPTAGYSGTAGFSYEIWDGQQASQSRYVSFEVTASTAATDDLGLTDQATDLDVDAAEGLLANDFAAPASGSLIVSAVNGEPANVDAMISGRYGQILIRADGSYVYVPGAGARTLTQDQSGQETFDYTVTDASGTTRTAALVITVIGIGGTELTGSGLVQGSAYADMLTGGIGRDVLLGLAGDDILIGGDGAADELYGGLGNDIYVVSVAADTIVELAGEGHDTVRTSLSGFTLRANVEDLVYTGTTSFRGVGNDEDNRITGGAGDDVLSGGRGNDVLIGGAGSDTADYASAGAGVEIYLNNGQARNDGDGGADTLVLIENITGSAFDDVLVGDAGGNILSGGLGRDVLIGLAGDDILIGGEGMANQMQGGVGNDIYVVSVAADTIVELAGEGHDTVRTSLSGFTLRANVEDLVYTGTTSFRGVGNDEDNRITGGAGDDVLSGGRGNDVLIGGAGSDTADYASAGAGVEIYLNNGQARNDGDGGADTLVLIENITGSAFDDVLVGDAGGNILSGGLGRDVLIGLAGDDILIGGEGMANQMQGGVGNDIYVVSVAADTIVELAGEGHDTVRTSLSGFTLRANVEDLVYTGTTSFRGVGNDEDNRITGGAGNDVLSGSGGDDFLLGGLGLDTAVYRGSRSEYEIEQIGDQWRVIDLRADRDGIDTLSDIEILTFADGTTLTLTGSGSFPAAETAKSDAHFGNAWMFGD